MFDCFTLSVHAIDIHASNAGIVGIIVEQVQEVHMGPDIVADRNDPVNDDTCPGSLARDLCEELAERDGPVRNQRVVLDVRLTYIFARCLLRRF